MTHDNDLPAWVFMVFLARVIVVSLIKKKNSFFFLEKKRQVPKYPKVILFPGHVLLVGAGTCAGYLSHSIGSARRGYENPHELILRTAIHGVIVGYLSYFIGSARRGYENPHELILRTAIHGVIVGYLSYFVGSARRRWKNTHELVLRVGICVHALPSKTINMQLRRLTHKAGQIPKRVRSVSVRPRM